MLTGYPHIDKPWTTFYTKKQDPSVPKLSIYDFMCDCTKSSGGKTAITYYKKELTYNGFLKEIEAAAKLLTFWGIKEKDRILYLVPNIPEAAYLLYATAMIGAVSDYIDPRPDNSDPEVTSKKILTIIDKEKITHIVSLDLCYISMIYPSEAELIKRGISSALILSASDSMDSKNRMEYLKSTRKINGLKDCMRKMISRKKGGKAVKDALSKSELILHRYPDLIKKSSNTEITKWKYEPNTIAVIVHTSGTSGSLPKPVPLTHENMNMHVKSLMASGLHFDYGMKHLQLLPWFAAFGVATGAHMVWCSCCNQIMIPDFSPDKLAEMITYYRPNGLCALPAWCMMLKSSEKHKRYDYSSLKEIVYGGDSMNPAEEDRVNHILFENGSDVKLSKGHGMSETCGASSYGNDEYGPLGSIGIPCPYVTYAVLSPKDKTPLHFDEDQNTIEGELAISGPTITPGILDGQIITPHIQIDGEDFILTGDTACMDRNGIMTFLSRDSRSFTRYDGYKIKPYVIEEYVKKQCSIADCVIAPYKDERKGGNMPRAFIVPLKSMPLDEVEAIDTVRSIVEKAFLHNIESESRQIPSSFRFISHLPLTENGKTDYVSLQNLPSENSDISVVFDETAMSYGEITYEAVDCRNK